MEPSETASRLVKLLDRHTLLQEPCLDEVLLHRVPGPGGGFGRRRQVAGLAAIVGQQFGDHPAHVVVLVVPHRDARSFRRYGAIHDVVGGQHPRARCDGHGSCPVMAETVRPPARAGGDDDARHAEFQHGLGVKIGIEADLRGGQLMKLLLTVVADPAPGGEPRQPAFAGDAAAKRGASLRQRHLVAPLAERLRRLEARRARAHD